MVINFSAHFIRQLQKLPSEIQQKLIQKTDLFKKNPFDIRLKTHKLVGAFDGFWAFSVTYKYRVIFVFEDMATTTFYKIGDHNIYH